MSYTTQIRTYLASLIVSVPSDVLAQLNALDQIGDTAMDLILSADNEGCCGELTVVDAEKMAELSNRLNSSRDDNKYLLSLALICRDDDGMAVDTVDASVSLDQVSTLIDAASELCLMHRKGQPIDAAIQQLDFDLVAAEIISAPNEVVIPDGFVEVVLEIDTENGLQDAEFSHAHILGSKAAVLIDTDLLEGCPATGLQIEYPDAAKYGVPDVVSQSGAEALIKRLGLQPTGLTINAKCTGDDSGEVIQITVQLPANAVVENGLDDVREYVGLHYKKHFQSLARDEQVGFVNRFVQSMRLASN